MRILVAPERFYPTMKAQAVAQAMARGLYGVSPEMELLLHPLASGGIGTTDLAVRIAQGRVRHEKIVLANRHLREVKWGLLPDGTAIFDAKDALGNPDGPTQLPKIFMDSRPLGQMIQRLLPYHPRKIAVALGDALAADGGMGLLQLFGVQPFDDDQKEVATGCRQLLRVQSVNFSPLDPPSIPLLALTDSHINWNMRVQKEDFRLDLIHGGLLSAAIRYADLLAAHVAVPLQKLPGTGAGGGLGMALAFLGAQFQLGAEFLVGLGSLRDAVWHVDWVMTGSEVMRRETVDQAVGTISGMARDAGVPAVGLTVEIGDGHQALYDQGLVGLYSVLDRPRSLKEVHRTLPVLIERAAFRVGTWMQAMSDSL